MGTYRKKPILVKAEQFREIKGSPASIGDTHKVYLPDSVVRRPGKFGWWVKTLEGWYKVNLGDYIITGIKGEHYPCRPDIFLETYEEVNDLQLNDPDTKKKVNSKAQPNDSK